MPSTGDVIKKRYELKQVLGRGGMGVVFQAYDREMRRKVAIKTLHDGASQLVLDLFYRECAVLADMVHPNIVEIFDMGDYQEEGIKKPYFVMSLLPGKTLHDLVYGSEEPIVADRLVDVVRQTCRGLQAAHDRGLLHRDVKPKNIFVMEDYSVKLIDFGVAHLLEAHSSTGIKGTPQYMAPEQITMKALSAGTDIFALSIVTYEAFARTNPFRRGNDPETASAILNFNPPLVSDYNRAVNRSIAQVINKGMAKDPLMRFSSASEFSDSLQKALHNEPIRIFSPAGIEIRIARARKYFEQGDYEFASEILKELQVEGQNLPEVQRLQGELEAAIRRRNASGLVDSANKYFKAEEHTLAKRKIREILNVDPTNVEALELKSKIDELESAQKVNELLEVARQHLANASFTKARQLLQDAFKVRADDTRVRRLLSEVDVKQKEFLRQRQEQEKLYQISQAAWVKGDISSALNNLQQLSELSNRTPEPAERIAEYKDFYNLVRSEHDALSNGIEKARAQLAGGELPAALALCRQFLAKYPGHAGFRALQEKISERQRQERIAFIEATRQQLADEADLDQRLVIAERAHDRFPDDPELQRELALVRERHNQVSAILDSAHNHEQSGDYEGAFKEWKTLQSVEPRYPAIGRELDRLVALLEQARVAAKRRWIEQIQALCETGDDTQAAELIASAKAEFPGDSELSELSELILQGLDRKGINILDRPSEC